MVSDSLGIPRLLTVASPPPPLHTYLASADEDDGQGSPIALLGDSDGAGAKGEYRVHVLMYWSRSRRYCRGRQ